MTNDLEARARWWLNQYGAQTSPGLIECVSRAMAEATQAAIEAVATYLWKHGREISADFVRDNAERIRAMTYDRYHSEDPDPLGETDAALHAARAALAHDGGGGRG